MKILFKYTTRSRRSNFLRGYDSIIKNVTSNDYHVLISVDKDDACMFPLPVLQGNHTYAVGESKNKINAINRDVNEFDYDWDILVNMSDDMCFIQAGFDDVIRYSFKEDNGTDMMLYCLDQCIHFPDQHQGENCMTMSIMGRTYYNRDKEIYKSAFESLWVDIVAQEEAQIRGCYKFVNQKIFLHLHPSFGDCGYDNQYLKTEDWGVRQRDYATYLRLKSEYDKGNRFPIRNI